LFPRKLHKGDKNEVTLFKRQQFVSHCIWKCFECLLKSEFSLLWAIGNLIFLIICDLGIKVCIKIWKRWKLHMVLLRLKEDTIKIKFFWHWLSQKWTLISSVLVKKYNDIRDIYYYPSLTHERPEIRSVFLNFFIWWHTMQQK